MHRGGPDFRGERTAGAAASSALHGIYMEALVKSRNDIKVRLTDMAAIRIALGSACSPKPHHDDLKSSNLQQDEACRCIASRQSCDVAGTAFPGNSLKGS